MSTKLTWDVLEQARTVSGRHSLMSGSLTTDMLGKLNGEQRRVFGLLEAIDYGCFEGNRNCIILRENTIEDVKDYLLERKTVINTLPTWLIPVPSILGLLSGQFDFLFSDSNTTEELTAK